MTIEFGRSAVFIHNNCKLQKDFLCTKYCRRPIDLAVYIEYTEDNPTAISFFNLKTAVPELIAAFVSKTRDDIDEKKRVVVKNGKMRTYEDKVMTFARKNKVYVQIKA